MKTPPPNLARATLVSLEPREEPHTPAADDGPRRAAAPSLARAGRATARSLAGRSARSPRPRPPRSRLAAGGPSRTLSDAHSRLERELSSLFDRLFTPANPLRSSAERGWHPFTDIYESEREYVIRMELAGIDPERLEVRKEGRYLIIRGHRSDPLAGRGLACHQMEISHGPFERVICLPDDFPEQAVRARHGASSGFLEITVLKELKG